MIANYNEFAARVQLAVDSALDNADVARTAQMYAGTLFVECNAYAADKIKTALKQQLGGGVRANKVGHEYAFDFV